MTVCALSLGSNLGNRLGNLRRAMESLRAAGKVIAKSGAYETPPWGVASQPRFLNACVAMETDRTPEDILSAAKEIERNLGREHRERWGPREIDIDILTYGDISLDEENLTIPHFHMRERAFVLVPLEDIFPEWRHPVTKESIHDLLEATGREGIIKITSL
ncbi:MAG: 2-amino-4-hydroxy-6-hydroxymethyldihydropteridine diphosphokinase [Synergistaceae bacterium]|jgi:2-amino-4-hydroxy-6-hydroxymethyldihydropteridine diphosphokinase|nr:2-amino-4-hydroxy-6-hydroxymethyldihydropteridine diphosphokinase [Synergistaceae bacterium]